MTDMKKLLFTGAATALVSPMNKDGSLNLEKYKELIEFGISEGIDALVAVGTTGENAVLSAEEHRSLMKCAVDTAKGRVPVICSTGSNDTEYCISTSKAAEDFGADGLLLVTPYYNKCTQAGIIKHYERILSQTSLPAIIYNVPSRTGFNISLDSYKILSQHPQIMGVKEASGNVGAATGIVSTCGDDLPVYSGNDDLIVPLMSIGAKGVISVLSNILPRITHEICQHCLDGDFGSAAKLAREYYDLTDVLFCEVNPIPIKEALDMARICEANLRLPLTRLSEEHQTALRVVLEKHGIVK